MTNIYSTEIYLYIDIDNWLCRTNCLREFVIKIEVTKLTIKLNVDYELQQLNYKSSDLI